MKSTLSTAGVAIVLSAASLGLITCATVGEPIDIYTCDNPDEYHKDENGNPDPCHRNDPDGGSDAGSDGGMSFCSSGTCVPPAPEPWKHVAFFMGWASEIPACPPEAPHLEFEGVPEPKAPSCPACSCGASEGTCSLPTKWTVSSTNCDNAGGGIQTNFEPPSGWDGTCTEENAVAQGKLCGGVPCVQSLTLVPPVFEEKPCVAYAEGAVDLPAPKAWAGGPEMPIGRACSSDKPLPRCTGQGCSSTNSSFGACIIHDGDEVCPEGYTGDRHVLYEHVDDARECTPCGCDPPTGGSCQVKWRVFSDSSCTTEIASGEIAAGMVINACHTFDPGTALGGKSAEIINHTKGSCAPTGGDLVGKLVLEHQVTVCCHTATI